MCVNDWRAGRFIRSAPSVRSLNAGSPITIPANRQRVGIIVCPTADDASGGLLFTVSVDGAAIDASLPFISGSKLTLMTHGDLPTRQIVVTTLQAGPFSIGVTEMFLTEEFLNAGTEQWKAMLLGGPR